MKITSRQLRHIIEEEITRITEGEVVDLFPKGKPGPQDKMALAKAMAARAEELLDLDGDGDDIEVRVEPSLFMQPYIDVDGHGNEVPSLVDHVYDNYVMGMAGDYAEKLDDIIGRIGIDYFDENIEYALKALGDDRFDGSQDQMSDISLVDDKKVASAEDGTYVIDGSVATDPEDSRPEQLQALRTAGVTHVLDNDGDGRTHTLDDWEAKVQMATTQDLASQQDPEEVGQMDLDFERYLQGIESGKVVDLETEKDK
jgi:hypothetical protein